MFEKDIMIVNLSEVPTDPYIKMLYIEISNRFVDCTRNIDQDLKDLDYGLQTFCDYSNVTESADFSNEEELKIIKQNVLAARALLTTNFKKKDSGINKLKYNFNADKYRLSTFADAGKWPNHKRKRYILVQQAKERIWSHLKLLLADDMQALLGNFMKRPHFSLSLRVYSYASMYLYDQWARIENIFSDKLNSIEKEAKEREIKEKATLLKRKLPELNYWKNREQYRKSRQIYNSDSVRLVKEAETEAMTFLNNENQSLVAYYNQKNPEEMPYAQRHKDVTGREPKKPYNRHKLASAFIESAFPTTESNTNEGEGGCV
nr:hypothetical protein [Klebsormidium nitens]